MARPASPGKAWVWDAAFNNGKGKAKGKWVQPANPGNAVWNDTDGWVTQQSAADEWGYALTAINSNSELRAIFDEAWNALKSGEEWSPQKFTNRIQSTNWYITRTEAQRNYYIAKNDPTQATEVASRINANKESLRSIANTLGASLNDEELTRLADENLMNGWNESQIKSNLSNYIKYSSDPQSGFDSLTGEAGNVEDNIRGFAKKMGVEVDNAWVLDQSRKAIAAASNTQAAEDFIRARAKEKYAAYAAELDTSTVEDLAYNYRSTMASTLELGIEEISLNDSLIKQAMAVGDGQGGKKNLFQFEGELRQDPRWAKTKNAKESSSTIVNDVLSTFGLI
jgi:hypothetical protein